MVFKKLDDRGRGFIASKDIKTGDLIYKDNAKISFLDEFIRAAPRFSDVDQLIRKEVNTFSNDEKRRFLSLKRDAGDKNYLPKDADITYTAIFMNNFLRSGKVTRDSYFPIISNMYQSDQNSVNSQSVLNS